MKKRSCILLSLMLCLLLFFQTSVVVQANPKETPAPVSTIKVKEVRKPPFYITVNDKIKNDVPNEIWKIDEIVKLDMVGVTRQRHNFMCLHLRFLKSAESIFKGTVYTEVKNPLLIKQPFIIGGPSYLSPIAGFRF